MQTIVVLGVGLATAGVVRQTMKNTLLKGNDYKMIVVTPSTHFHFPIAMPRVVVPGQYDDDKALYDLQATFKGYPKDKFEFVLGAASSLDPKGNSVTISLNDGGVRSISYDLLIIGTGSSAKEQMPWKLIGNTEKTKEAIHKLRNDVKRAKTIAVVGGGSTGVEMAGELGNEYAKKGKKDILFIYSGDLPLAAPIIDSVRQQTEKELKKLKVQLMPKTTVVNTTKEGEDTIIELRTADGTTKSVTVQAYVPTVGVVPNTAFVPAHMLDGAGYIKQTRTLQAEGHDDIIVVGDAGSLEANKAMYAFAQAEHLVKHLPTYLQQKKPLSGKLPEYQPATKPMNGISVGPSTGTGHMGNMRMFNIMIWYFKSRYLMTDIAAAIAAGKRTTGVTWEK